MSSVECSVGSAANSLESRSNLLLVAGASDICSGRSPNFCARGSSNLCACGSSNLCACGSSNLCACGSSNLCACGSSDLCSSGKRIIPSEDGSSCCYFLTRCFGYSLQCPARSNVRSCGKFGRIIFPSWIDTFRFLIKFRLGMPPTQVAPTSAPVPAPTKAPVISPVASPVSSPVASPVASPTNSNFPLYPGSNGLICECRWYVQDIIVSNSGDWGTLNQQELSGFLKLLLAMPNKFNPYPFTTMRARRKMLSSSDWSSLRGSVTSGTEVTTTEKTSPGSSLNQEKVQRVLQPSALSYSLAMDSQTPYGTPGSPPFGTQMIYSFVFCLNDPSYLGDYFSAFVKYLSNSTNQDQMAASISSLGLTSCTGVTTPFELSNRTCTGQ